MSNKISTKIDLMKVPGAQRLLVPTENGQSVDCLVIPVQNGYLYPGEKGVYMNTVTSKRQTPSYGWEYSVKISATSEFYKSLSDEQRKLIPFIGDAKDMNEAGAQSGSAQPPIMGSKPAF